MATDLHFDQMDLYYGDSQCMFGGAKTPSSAQQRDNNMLSSEKGCRSSILEAAKPSLLRQNSKMIAKQKSEDKSPPASPVIPHQWQVYSAYYGTALANGIKKIVNSKDEVEPICPLSAKKWTQSKLVNTARCPHSLRLIGDMLWMCHDEGIVIYDADLEVKRDLPCPEIMRCLRDVSVMHDGQIIVASTQGLFELDESGKLENEIDKGIYMGVQAVGSKVYAVKKNCTCLFVYSKKENCWTQISKYALPFKRMNAVSFTVNYKTEKITVCCSNNNTICILDTKGTVLNTYSRYTPDNGERYWPKWPVLCSEDAKGIRIVADHNRHLIRVWNGRKTWQNVDITPDIKCPRCAVANDNVLYVLLWSTDSLVRCDIKKSDEVTIIEENNNDALSLPNGDANKPLLKFSLD